MADLTLQATVTRPILGLADLNLNVAGFAKVVSYTPAGRSLRRVVAKSPTVAGHAQTGSVPDSDQVILVVRLYGTSKSNLDANVQTVQDAFGQFAYQLSVVVNGATVTWACDDADWSLQGDHGGSDLDKFSLIGSAPRQAWRFTIPVQPYPTAGVF